MIRRLLTRAAPWIWRDIHLDRLHEAFGTPEWISAWMQRSLRYAHDHELHGEDEYWQSPIYTWSNREGDCEDWALLAQAVLARAGERPEVFVAFTENEGHAVCAVPRSEAWLRICNQGLIQVDMEYVEARNRWRAARHLAASIYPSGWTACGYVHLLEHVEHCHSGDVLRFEPRFEWLDDIAPDATSSASGLPPLR